jgi:hypothetical protein
MYEDIINYDSKLMMNIRKILLILKVTELLIFIYAKC